jgi:hypothetical protein
MSQEQINSQSQTQPQGQAPAPAPVQQQEPPKEAGSSRFVVVNSDMPQAAPQPEPKAGEEKPVKGPESAPDKTSQEPEDKHDSRLQKRFDRLTRQKGDAERRADAAEQELATLKASKKQESPAQDKEPQIEDFETWDAFDDAHKAWDKKQGQGKAPEKSAEEQGKNPVGLPVPLPEPSDEMKAAAVAIRPSFDAARQAHPDFDQVIGANDLAMPEEVALLIADTDNPGEVAYWLGMNKAEAKRIAGLTPIKQVKAISEIEAKLKEAPPSRKISKAPSPINTLDGTGNVQRKLSDARSQAEYREIKRELGTSSEKRGREGWL